MTAARSGAPTLPTGRLLLVPLRDDPEIAKKMARVLSDPALYTHIGGNPPDGSELRVRYARQSGGASFDGPQAWLNWIVQELVSGEALGFIQVTLVPATGTADIAWVIGTRFQRHGFASEAA